MDEIGKKLGVSPLLHFRDVRFNKSNMKRSQWNEPDNEVFVKLQPPSKRVSSGGQPFS